MRISRINSVHVQCQALEVCWSDGAARQFPLIWLRDNCPCEACLHPHTQERTFDLLTVPEIPGVASALVRETGDVEVRWSDDQHISAFSSQWLRASALQEGEVDLSSPPVKLWDSADMRCIPRYEYQGVMDSDQALNAWLDGLLTYGLAIVTGTPTKDRQLMKVAERVAYVRPTNFGVHFEVRSEQAPINNAYTSLRLANHTDLVNWEQPPGFQLLHCLHNEATGGDSTLVDGFCAAEALRGRDPDAFQVLATMPVDFRYHDTEKDLRARAPIIGLDYENRLQQIRFNFGLFTLQRVSMEAQSALYVAYRRFAEMLQSSEFAIEFRLEPGDLLIIDNWRVLHGRSEFDPSTGKRHLQGCYVDRDELFSRWRVTRPSSR